MRRFTHEQAESALNLLRFSHGRILYSAIITVLEREGIDFENDFRFDPLKEAAKLQPEVDIYFDRNDLPSLLGNYHYILIGCILQSLAVPRFPNFKKKCIKMYEDQLGNEEGTVSNYLPELTTVNPNYWGVGICSVDGQRFLHGDFNVPFPSESCCKPFIYGLALKLLGTETVHKYIGKGISGYKRNSIMLNDKNIPHNAFINSGSIVACCLLENLALHGLNSADRQKYIHQFLLDCAGGGHVLPNNLIFLSERENGAMNYCIGHFLESENCLPGSGDISSILDLYFQCCAMDVTCDSLSVMAATLANGGTCPVTGKEVLSPEETRNVLSMMGSCGMYNYSGEFSYYVGQPGKGSISGGVFLVVPKVLGIAVYSPRLDETDISRRGLNFIKAFVKEFSYHPYEGILSRLDQQHVSHQFDLSCYVHCPLFWAVINSNTDLITRMSNAGMNLLVVDEMGHSALHAAVAAKNHSMVKFLVEMDPNFVTIRDDWNRTCLDFAEELGCEEICETLRAYSASATITD